MVTTWLMIVGTASVATALGTGTDSNSSFSVYFVMMNFCLLSKPGKARCLGFSRYSAMEKAARRTAFSCAGLLLFVYLRHHFRISF